MSKSLLSHEVSSVMRWAQVNRNQATRALEENGNQINQAVAFLKRQSEERQHEREHALAERKAFGQDMKKNTILMAIREASDESGYPVDDQLENFLTILLRELLP